MYDPFKVLKSLKVFRKFWCFEKVKLNLLCLSPVFVENMYLGKKKPKTPKPKKRSEGTHTTFPVLIVACFVILPSLNTVCIGLGSNTGNKKKKKSISFNLLLSVDLQ